ncbi:MAG: GAF domain-containing protein [Cypionkella sp.]|nr:GAF domain-containing protein [Cypionkella sp.]
MTQVYGVGAQFQRFGWEVCMAVRHELENMVSDPVNIQELNQSLTEVMAERVDAPIGLTTVVDEANDRQVFIAAIGLPEPVATLRETPLSRSFCRIVKATNAPLIVTNAREDERVRENPIIKELGVMSYLGYPLRAPDGAPLGSVCVLDIVPRDWTEADCAQVSAIAEMINQQMNLQASLLTSEYERRQIEGANRALDEKNRQFIDLAENMPGAIFQYIETAEGSVVVDLMSPGCMDIWEVPATALTQDAQPMWDMVFPEDLPAMQATVRRSAEELSTWNHRWRIKTPSGKVKWLEGRGQPRRRKDGSVLWNSLILDVTHTVAAEQKAAETMRLLFEAGKQETISRIAGGIAHDFNNLLMVVRGNAEMLIDAARDVDRAALGRSIIKAAELGGELTKRLVNFTRQSEMHPSLVKVNSQITDMRGVLRSALPARIDLDVALGENAKLS